MPTIAIFYGMVIEMFWRDHPPPHFHVSYQQYRAVIAIESGELLQGKLPAGARRDLRAGQNVTAKNCWIIGSALDLVFHFGQCREPTKMIEFVDVIDLKPLPGFKLWLLFSNGREGVRDFADILAEGGPMVEPLKDEAFFSRVVLHHTVPAWPNGYALDATNLHMELEQAGLLSSPVAAE